jgi:DNA-binding response OmpR family regulator
MRPEPAGPDSAEVAAQSRVLVVHGEATTRQAIARGLAYEMLVIVEAASARAAIDCVAAEPIDLILLDVAPPDVGGIQLLRLLKGDARSYDIPVIMIAAADQGDGVVDCLEAGADDYLSQPLHPVVLRIRVNAALEKKRLRDSERALQEAIVTSRLARERVLQKMLAAHKLEFVQLQETIKALRKQLDATTATAKANVDAARSSAAAELRQLRATCRVLREQVDAAISGQGRGGASQPSSDRPQGRPSDGR